MVYTNKSMSIIRCLVCKTLFRPKEEHNIFNPVDNASKYYSESHRCVLGNRMFFRLVLKDLVKKYPHIKKGNFLDFGSGIGNALLEARGLGFNALGLDCSKWAIDHCRKLGLEILSSFEDLENKKTKFDLINLNHVLEHICQPVDLLIKLKDFLREDGILRIEVPNCSKFFIWKHIPRCKYIVNKPSSDHIYYFDINTLRNVLLKSGLEVIDIHKEGFGDRIRHKVTMLNPDIFARCLSTFFYFTKIEKATNLESFLIAVAKKKLTG